MYISKFIIRNFRNFESAEFNFNEGVNTIIGENGSGKTNLFYALRLMLDDTLPRHIGFSEQDFCRSLGKNKWQGHWIVLTIVFDKLDLNDESQALAIHSIGHMTTDENHHKGTYTLCFRPKHQFRQELYEYSLKENKCQNDLQEILRKITVDDYETVCLCRGAAEFHDDEAYKNYIGDFDEINFPNPNDERREIYGEYLPRELSLYDEISCTFIKALRDVASDLRSYSKNPLVNLLKGKGKSIVVGTQDDLIKSIDDLNESISTLEEVIEVQVGIDGSLKQAVGTTYAPNIQVRAELPNEMDKLLQSLKLWVGDSDDEHIGQISELSLGGANLIFLSLKLFEYEKVKTDRVANLLLIEEPEAHIHTHIQKTLFDNLGKHEHKPQIFISTHSTQISSVSQISNINILSRQDKKSVVFDPTNGLDKNKTKRIERYLDAVRSDLLFAKGVLLVEGDAEQILLPVMFKEVFGLSLDEIGVSLINIGSTGFENIANIFHQDRINRRCAIVTDLDEAFITLPSNEKIDDKIQKSARASQKSGIERKASLESFCRSNECINPFFAKHTFEVDLIIESNSDLFISCLSDIYDREVERTKSKEKLESNDIAISGTESLRLAIKEGKGWFALKLADHIDECTNIPNYILEAVAWASPHMNYPSILKSAKYRLSNCYESTHDAIESGEEYDWDWESEIYNGEINFVAKYIQELPEDPLTKLLNHYDS